MAWQNYDWAWKIRGLSIQLKHVCTILANEASSSGLIEQLRHQRLASQCELSRDQTRRYIYELIKLGFIKERKARFRAEGDQAANAYQLNLDVYHPPDTTGPALWKFIVTSFPPKSEMRQAANLHALDVDTFYNPARQLLHVWIASRRDKSFFEMHRSHLHQYAQNAHKDIRSFEFII